MPRIRFLIASLVCLFTGIAGLHASDDAHLGLAVPQAVDAVIDGYVEEGAFPFVYVRLEDQDGRVFYEHAAVNDKLLNGQQVDGSSWMRIWSMSKIVTISVLMDLVEDGVLKLSDPVVKYIPEFAGLEVAVSANGEDLSLLADKKSACPLKTVPAKYQMTVLDLLNHRAGFYYEWTGIECLDLLFSDVDLPAADNSDDLVTRLASLPLINQPGTTSYYGTGTAVLGLVAERATGKSLKQLVIDRVTGPMGIKGLQYGLPAGEQLPPRISGKGGVLHQALADEMEEFGSRFPPYEPDSELYLGGEGMVATADGYADFARMLLRRGELNGYRFLEESTVEEIAAPHTDLDSPWGHNGYNLWVSNGKLGDGEMGPAPLWIGGGYEGTHFWIDPEREFVGIIMSQIVQVPEQGHGRDEAIRKAIYEQLETR
ncbi:MAG: serine hydrolase domain-containing protein [Xanthomonadales bacterium]|nr:serine hydrolase domain-containing protein [Xanthomonadales bacterium]